MKPDQKYMTTHYSDSKDAYDISFAPLKSNSIFRNDFSLMTPFINLNDSLFNASNRIKDDSFDFRAVSPTNNTNKINIINYSELFPSETDQSELYCYHNDLNDTKNPSTKKLTPDEILRDFDLDLDESMDLERSCCDNDINNIYSEIEKQNPAIINTLSSYNLPYPISRLLIKRIIKLSLKYCNKK